jgi:hypothetical protein
VQTGGGQVQEEALSWRWCGDSSGSPHTGVVSPRKLGDVSLTSRDWTVCHQLLHMLGGGGRVNFWPWVVRMECHFLGATGAVSQ